MLSFLAELFEDWVFANEKESGIVILNCFGYYSDRETRLLHGNAVSIDTFERFV